MKKFLSLLFLVSSFSLLHGGWKERGASAGRIIGKGFVYPFVKIGQVLSYPFRGKATDASTPATTNTSDVKAAGVDIVKKISQMPKAAYSSTKTFVSAHPNLVKVTLASAALVAADKVAKKTSKWYRENLAIYIVFGEKNLHQASQAALNANKPVKPAAKA